MKYLRHLILVVVIPALILAVFAVSSVVAGGPSGKTTICHRSSHFHAITVSNNALAAHMNHGDVLPDEYGDCP